LALETSALESEQPDDDDDGGDIAAD